jgi:hypothetical protein
MIGYIFGWLIWCSIGGFFGSRWYSRQKPHRDELMPLAVVVMAGSTLCGPAAVILEFFP